MFEKEFDDFKAYVENTFVVDEEISDESTNPVQNKVVKSALESKQDALITDQLAAVNSGIINGYDDGMFRPDNTATRGETAAMVCRILNYITEKELIREPDPLVDIKEDEYGIEVGK